MAKYFYILLCLFAPVNICAQEVADSVMLGEVTVKADRVIRTAEGMKVIPSAGQLAASANGYSLLRRLSLPQIKVDEVMQTVSSNEMVGAVEVRINGIVASPHDMMSLDMKAVVSVEYIQRPGLNYGPDAGRVININTRRADGGYVAGGQVAQALTTGYGKAGAYAKINRGRHELALDYSFDAADWNGTRSTDRSHYLLDGGVAVDVTREDMTSCNKTIGNHIGLKYSMAEQDRYVLQVALTGAFRNNPALRGMRSERYGGGPESMITRHIASGSATPQLDVYFHCNMPGGQSLTFNAVGSYRHHDYNYTYGTQKPYSYSSEGRLYQLSAECRYRKRWKTATLSGGGNYSLLYSHDEYSGSISAANSLHRSKQYLYAQLSGTVWRNLNYQAALGYDGMHGRQGSEVYDYRQIVPTISLTYNISSTLSAGYTFTLRQIYPRLAMINDITSMSNDMEYDMGNPAIKPHKRIENMVEVSLRAGHINSSLTAMYRANPNTWMDDIRRKEDNRFYFMKSNSGDCNMLYISSNTTVQIIPDRMDVRLDGSFIRCFNLTDTYTHCYSGWMGGAGINAYLGKWSVSASVDSGWRSMEGESRMKQGMGSLIAVQRQLGSWGTVSVAWQNIFSANYRSRQVWIVNDKVQKHVTQYSEDLGNLVFATLSVNLSHGRKYQAQRKDMDNTEVETTAVMQN